MKASLMDSQANPIYKAGDRNFQCRYYDHCKKKARKNDWNFWTCCDCNHKLMGTAVTLVKRKRNTVSPPKMCRFQLLSKKWVGPEPAVSSKTSQEEISTERAMKPLVFRFHHPNVNQKNDTLQAQEVA
jgi:hypothetical protein